MTRHLSCQGATALFTALAFGVPHVAHGQSSFKMTGTVLDSEHANFWKTLPTGELTCRQPARNKWSASVQLRLVPLKPNDPNNSFEVRLKEGYVAYESPDARNSLGRIPIRMKSIALNDSTRSFLRSEPFVDGYQISKDFDGLQSSISFGGPQVAALSISQSFSNLHASVLYRGERNRITEISMPDSNGKNFKLKRAAHSHEGEFYLRQMGDNVQTEGLLQIHQQGALRRISDSDERFSRFDFGDVDADLPKTQFEYRAATQMKWLLDKSELNSNWLIVAFASKNAARLYSGTPEQIALKQGSNSSSMFTLGVDSSTPQFSAQAGLSTELNSKKQFALFARKDDDGNFVLVRPRFTVWYAAQLAL